MTGRFARYSSFSALLLMTILSRAEGQAIDYHQHPDEDGVYYVGPEVTAPGLTRSIALNYRPNSALKKSVQGMTVLAMVIDAQGLPQHIEILHSHGDVFDQAAIDAVKTSQFSPGHLGGKPVPVWIDVRYVFRTNLSTAVPEVLITERDLAPPDLSELEIKHRSHSHTDPIPIHTVDADFVNPLSKHPYVQVAVVSLLVNREGQPEDVRIRRGLGFGLDEKAIAAVRHYRFLPATKNGVPVPERRDIEVNFALF